MKVREILKVGSEWYPPGNYDTAKPLVTVTLPTYARNRDGILKRAIESVLNQSFQRWELIVIDDCSTDGSFDLVQEFMEKDPRIGCIRHTRNVGLHAISQYEAFVKGRGDYFAFMFDDNEWYPDALGKTYDLMIEKGVKASFGLTEVLDPDTHEKVTIGRPSQNLLDLLPFTNIARNGAVVLHREVFETVGMYDPHLSLTRICDWDLWLRIVDRYAFLATGIPFSKEYGTVLPDSLGNAFKLDLWFAQEHMQHRNLDALLPENYLDADICIDEYPHSAYYCACMERFMLQYQKKAWYQPFHAEQLNQSEQCRRVLVSLPGAFLDASHMNFYRCRNPYLTIRYKTGVDLLVELQLADILVFSRAVAPYKALESALATARIPVYYFTDDNFIEIAKDNPHDPGAAAVAGMLTKETLDKIDGIIVTTRPLKEYFLKNELHRNVLQLDAVARPEDTVFSAPGDDGVTTVAFLGGMWRGDAFRSIVFPAIQRISKKHPIRLVLSKESAGDLLEFTSENLEIVGIPRNLNLEFILNRYKSYRPSILVHCGRTVRNNLYKTKNALLNAVSLGAALVASDVEPYCFREADEPENDYVLVENSENAWYNALLRLVENQEECRAIFERGREYCNTHYSSERIWAELFQEFERKPGGDMVRYVKQAEAALVYVARSGGAPSTQQRINHRYIPEELCTSGALRRKRTYGITCTTELVTRVGLLFAVFGACTGICGIRLSKDGKTLAEGSVPIERIVRDGYTFFPLSACVQWQCLEQLDLTIEVTYTGGDGHIEAFEHRKKRTFWYKVFNRLGMPLKGRDTLFVDLC